MPPLRRQRTHTANDIVNESQFELTGNFTVSLVDQDGTSRAAQSQPRLSHFVPVRRSHSKSHRTFNDARDFDRLVSLQPGGVIEALKEGATELGKIESTDTIVNAAFGSRQILTRGGNTPTDADYKDSWKNTIEDAAYFKDPDQLGGWNEPVTLTAYSVSIKDAAMPLGQGVLTPVLRREQKGVQTDKIWEFLSVKAIIQHKWDRWASFCLFWEFILYLGWLVPFILFLLIYIERDISEDYDIMSAEERSAAFTAYVADISSLIFMVPFIVKEYNEVVYYGRQWIQMWNVIDACTYIFQILIGIFHFSHFFFNGRVFTTMLAVQCVLLFIKVQYYCRVIEVGGAYVESLKALIINVRGLLLFIVLTIISASLAFASLYKWDTENSSPSSNEELDAFSSFPRSIVATFAVLLGNFEPSYIFHTQNRALKGISFVLFTAVMSIAVLNLLIAVMTQSYASILERGVALHNRCRADTIDRLEVTLPGVFYPKYDPYIHFLVREDKDSLGNQISGRGRKRCSESLADSWSEIDELKKMIKELNKKIDQLSCGTNELELHRDTQLV